MARASGPTESSAPAPGEPIATQFATEKVRHPKGLYVLFGVEMWERFSFYGMRSILTLYLAATATGNNPGRGWSQGESSILMGWYGGMCYLLPIVGGMLADRFIGTHRSMLIGGLLIAMGHVVLGLTGLGDLAHNALGLSCFIGGLTLICIGTGYFKPCVTVMVGQLYTERDVRRDSAFAIFYFGINLGSFFGQTICGWLAEKVNWHYGFGAAAVGMLAGLAMYLLLRPRFLSHVGLPRLRSGATAVATLQLLVGVGLAALITWAYFLGYLQNAYGAVETFQTSGNLLAQAINYGLVALVLGSAISFVWKQQPADRGPTACIFIFIVFNAVFWLGFEQAATSLNFFADRNTDLTLGGLLSEANAIPAPWMQNVNPLLVMGLSPLFAMFWAYLARNGREISQPAKIGLGLIFLGIGYLFVTVGAAYASTGIKVSVFWLIALYTWHTIGELFVSPTGLSFVTKVAPVRFVSLLMGVWYIANFLAHYVGGMVASKVEAIEKGETSLPWYSWFKIGGQGDYYLAFVIASITAGIIILLATPALKKLLHGRG